MHIRNAILCLAAIFVWSAHDVDVASGQSSHLMEAYNNFNTLYEQGRYLEAERYAEEALRLSKEEFGPNDPNTAILLNDLALLYQVQGRYAEAEPLFQRSLTINEKVLGLNNLALLYRAQGYYAEAEPLYMRALAIYENALGPEHPDVVTSLENYAALLRLTARPDEAEKIEARAKAIRAKSE